VGRGAQVTGARLRRDRNYRVTFDNTGETLEFSGQALTDPGIAVRLPAPMTSELLLIEEMG
jgi:hypothetical protein